MCVCVRACVYACVRVCVYVCARARVCARLCVRSVGSVGCSEQSQFCYWNCHLAVVSTCVFASSAEVCSTLRSVPASFKQLFFLCYLAFSTKKGGWTAVVCFVDCVTCGTLS